MKEQRINLSFGYMKFLLSIAAIIISGPGSGKAFGLELEDLASSRRVDWSQAGYPGGIPFVDENVVNVKENGVTGDGTTDEYAAIQNLINNSTVPTILFFPAGNYKIESALVLKAGIIIRGEGATKTHLRFFSANGCFNVRGGTGGNFVAATSGIEKGSTSIVVENPSTFAVGGGAMIRQDDIDAVDPTGEWGSSGWVPEKVVGQMFEITSINGNTLNIQPALNIDFNPSKKPEIRAVNYITNVGLEAFHLERINTTTTSSSNVYFDYAKHCWIRGVESDYTQKYHFAIKRSLQLEIRECYIHDTRSKGDGGQGYGTSLGTYATAILVEDNIFNELRHAMIVQLGVNGSVFGYNYAQRNYSNDGWDKTYISVHGHYPFMNLFEGNIVGWAGLADYWGASGPGNTLFRNRIVGTDKHKTFGSYRGIDIDDYSHRQNIIGNELVGDSTRIAFDGHESMSSGTSLDVIVHGNNVHGTIVWDGDLTEALPPSFYLRAKPEFYGDIDWPSLGGDKALGAGTIPAKERFDRGEYIPQFPGEAQDGLDLAHLIIRFEVMECGDCPEDLNGDDIVNGEDLQIFAKRFGGSR